MLHARNSFSAGTIVITIPTPGGIRATGAAAFDVATLAAFDAAAGVSGSKNGLAPPFGVGGSGTRNGVVPDEASAAQSWMRLQFQIL